MKQNFQHGGNIYAARRSLGSSDIDLIDFSANINPLGLAPMVSNHLQQAFRAIEHYPDLDNREALLALSEYHRCPDDELVIGNGAAELFQLLCLAIAPHRVVAVTPTYSGYAFAAGLYGIPYFSFENDPEGLADVAALVGHLRSKDLLFFCNPNNPTGQLYSREYVDTLAYACESVDATLVVDESFHEFLPIHVAPKSYTDEGSIPPHVVVVRSLTKIMALPGLRLGYLRANSSVAKAIRAKRDPWSVNVLALEAARLYPSLTYYIDEARAMVQQESAYLRSALSTQERFRVVSGEVNFLFIAVHSKETSTDLCQRLLHRRIMVRNCNTYPLLGERYIRIAVRTHTENQRLVKALSEVDDATVCNGS